MTFFKFESPLSLGARLNFKAVLTPAPPQGGVWPKVPVEFPEFPENPVFLACLGPQPGRHRSPPPRGDGSAACPGTSERSDTPQGGAGQIQPIRGGSIHNCVMVYCIDWLVGFVFSDPLPEELFWPEPHAHNQPPNKYHQSLVIGRGGARLTARSVWLAASRVDPDPCAWGL